jgi:murein DD-endopeptidase MepM/ murein hydrolase activator NlpD
MEQVLEKKLPFTGIEFESVVPFDPSKDKLLMLDFSDSNSEITHDILADTEQFTTYINRKLREAGATYGIGGYGESRAVYSVSSVFDAKEGTEPRRVHLGIDIWGKPHTKVMAPLDGIVHSFAFNNAYGDYGATVILAHHVNDSTFYTLYGHLSLNSLANREEGETIRKGDIFAEFGIPVENGHWPPHLHFQVIYNLEGMKGDYPGVCADSEREKYFANCPDPDVILHMMKYAQI